MRWKSITTLRLGIKPPCKLGEKGRAMLIFCHSFDSVFSKWFVSNGIIIIQLSFPVHTHLLTFTLDLILVMQFFSIGIGAELGGAAGARAPPLLHNPRKFMIWGEKSPKFPVPALY